MTMTQDTKTAGFAAVEARLRQILEPLRAKLVATRDRPGDLALEIPGLEGKPWAMSPRSAAASATSATT